MKDIWQKIKKKSGVRSLSNKYGYENQVSLRFPNISTFFKSLLFLSVENIKFFVDRILAFIFGYNCFHFFDYLKIFMLFQ